jgi:hypothetical protein
MPKTLTAMKASLKLYNRRIDQLQSEVTRLTKYRDAVKEKVDQEELKALGLVRGAKYRIVPKESAGDIIEGKFSRFSVTHWSGNHYAVFRCAAKNGRGERIAHFPPKDFEFERVNAAKGVPHA